MTVAVTVTHLVVLAASVAVARDTARVDGWRGVAVLVVLAASVGLTGARL